MKICFKATLTYLAVKSALRHLEIREDTFFLNHMNNRSEFMFIQIVIPQSNALLRKQHYRGGVIDGK